MRPVDELNDAQAGRLTTLNFSALPSGSDAVGLNEYVFPATTEGAGVPEMIGALFDGSHGSGSAQQYLQESQLAVLRSGFRDGSDCHGDSQKYDCRYTARRYPYCGFVWVHANRPGVV